MMDLPVLVLAYIHTTANNNMQLLFQLNGLTFELEPNGCIHVKWPCLYLMEVAA